MKPTHVRVADHKAGAQEEITKDQYLYRERRFGSFARSITLPSTADPEGIQASFDAGVLTIEVPKREEAKPRKIEVKATG